VKHIIIKAATHRQVILETLEWLRVNRYKGAKTPAVLTYADQRTVKTRVAIGDRGSLMCMYPRSRSRCYKVHDFYAETNPANAAHLLRRIVLTIPQ